MAAVRTLGKKDLELCRRARIGRRASSSNHSSKRSDAFLDEGFSFPRKFFASNARSRPLDLRLLLRPPELLPAPKKRLLLYPFALVGAEATARERERAREEALGRCREELTRAKEKA